MPHQTILCDGLRLRADDRGHGLPLLFVHGMWCDHQIFARVTDELTPAFRTIALDLRGHGQSQLSRRPWTVADLARDLCCTLDALSLEKAVVIGHSLGGMAALHMALRFPERLKGLVLLSTSAEAETPERRAQLQTLGMALRMPGASRWLARKAAEVFFSPEFARRAPEDIDRWCAAVRSMKKRALLQDVEAIRTRPSVVHALETIRVPALVMCAAADPIADAARSEAMARLLPNGNHWTLPGGGHALPMEHAAALADALRHFLMD
jgi:3-oxoadipate enol-lactonase